MNLDVIARKLKRKAIELKNEAFGAKDELNNSIITVDENIDKQKRIAKFEREDSLSCFIENRLSSLNFNKDLSVDLDAKSETIVNNTEEKIAQIKIQNQNAINELTK